MPQPLNRVKYIQTMTWGTGALANHANLAVLIVQVINNWAIIDFKLAYMLSRFLGSRPEIGMAMYFALSGGAARRDALRAAASKALSPDDLSLVNRVLKATTASRERRNEFAHGQWGESQELPDALLWQMPRDTMLSLLAMSGPTGVASSSGFDNVMVYRENDLQRDLMDSQEAGECFLRLLAAVSAEQKEDRDRARTQLLGLPLLVGS